jgi:hypothetical protein
MCLTGVDYFSTLGYQPGIAALAAGVLSPLATLVLVIVTLGGALPVYRHVARESPRGEGSIAILERLLPRWRGKLVVLVLLGFAATDFLIMTSVVTTLLIPPDAFRSGGPANGGALAFLAHEHLGNGFGTLYDASTIAILWFAGASAMAGLLNLVPRYLPRYGMAPHWARAVRPLVLLFTAIAFLVTVLFRADVDAQGGAYATGVLVLITSAAVAVTLSVHHSRRRRSTVIFAVIAAVFVYTTIANIIERPEGVKIAACFVGGIILVSFPSRLIRAFELRVTAVYLDETAERLLSDAGPGPVASSPTSRMLAT